MTVNTTNIIASIFNIENGIQTYNDDTNNDVIVIDTSNIRLGIGTANPEITLDVNGDICSNIIYSNSDSLFSDISHDDYRILNVKQIRDAISSISGVNRGGSGGGTSQGSISTTTGGGDNFFFFFQAKPWPPIYLDGIYNYPLPNTPFINPTSYNSGTFYYEFGNINNSKADNLSNGANPRLQLFFKIPPRMFINWNYNTDLIQPINYIGLYNRLKIDYRRTTNTSIRTSNIINLQVATWENLFDIDFIRFDPSNISIDYKNDLCMNFIVDISQIPGSSDISSSPSPTSSIPTASSSALEDNSFNINYNFGRDNPTSKFKINEIFQFRIYFTNYSTFDISRIPGIKLINQFNQSITEVSYNYLFFPDSSDVYYETVSRGAPNPPTGLTFSYDPPNNAFVSNIDFCLNQLFADTNSAIPLSTSIPITSESNYIVFVLDLSSVRVGFKKATSFPSSYLELVNNIIDISVSSRFPTKPYTISNNAEIGLLPEYRYDVSSYGMHFYNSPSDISYVSSSNLNTVNFDNSFLISVPLRNQVNNEYISINDYTNIFPTDISENLSDANYTVNVQGISYETVFWREPGNYGNIKHFNFFDSSSSLSLNIQNIKLFVGISGNNINSSNESIGLDLSGIYLNELSFNIFLTQNGGQDLVNPTMVNLNIQNITHTFGSEIFENKISETNNNKIDLSYRLIDICNNLLNTYSGYYLGNDLSNINFIVNFNNDSNTNIHYFQPDNSGLNLNFTIAQTFRDGLINLKNSNNYLIYKIDDSLKKNFIINSYTFGNSTDYSSINSSTFFGIKSVNPHSIKLQPILDLSISNLNTFIKPMKHLYDIVITLSNVTEIIDNRISQRKTYNFTREWQDNILSTDNHTFDFFLQPYADYMLINFGSITTTLSYELYAELTLYNNLFSPVSHETISYETYIPLDYQFFWDINPKNGWNSSFQNLKIYTVTGNFITEPDSTSIVEYTTTDSNRLNSLTDNNFKYLALIQKGSCYGPANPHVYKNYSNFYENNNPDVDYSTLDDVSINIFIQEIHGIQSWYNYDGVLNGLNTNLPTILDNYKVICFDINENQPNGINLTINLHIYDTSYIAPNVLYFLKRTGSDVWYNANALAQGGAVSLEAPVLSPIATSASDILNNLLVLQVPGINITPEENCYIIFLIKSGFDIDFSKIDFSF